MKISVKTRAGSCFYGFLISVRLRRGGISFRENPYPEKGSF
ncbi:MAG TPA: hypothetical protein PKK94_09860 [Leptospiraceae bacterium]|nr:hypothetical protein [Leptospiraceae bacterium]